MALEKQVVFSIIPAARPYLTNGYNGHLTSREAGSVGGQMVKKMIEAYERNL